LSGDSHAPLSIGEPTIPVTDIKNYESDPKVPNPDLRVVSEEQFEKVETLHRIDEFSGRTNSRGRVGRRQE